MANLVPNTWINSVTPQFATVRCGNITQTDTFVTTSTTPEDISFTTPASWCDLESFTSEDGFIWNCNRTGIYNLRFNQTLDVAADQPIIDSSTVIVPNTTFYLDISGSVLAPAEGTLALTHNSTTQSDVTASAAVIGTVMMAEFITPVGFLTSPVIPGADWDLVVTASTNGTSSGIIAPTQPLYIGQYCKSASQNAPSGSTEVTFNTATNWLNTNGYIDHTNGTADFTCRQAGVYQLEFSVYMAPNGSTWTVLSKDVAIHVTRIGIAEQQILRNRFSSTSGLDWSNSLVGTVELQAGDIVQCVVTQTVTGTPLILGVQNTFDYNTTFTFTYVKQLANILQGMNSLYYSVFSVDADGTSNELTIVNGSQGLPPTVINSSANIFYHLIQTIPPTLLDSVSRRIIIRIYGTFSTPSDITLYFRGEAIASVQTTLSQRVVPKVIDVVNARITVDSATSEFNQVFASSIPVSIPLGDNAVYSTSVNAIANVYAGDQVTCSINVSQGGVTVTSGETSLPAPANTLQWNLIAQGAYGNPDIVVAPMMMMMSPIDIIGDSLVAIEGVDPLESFTDNSLADALRASLE